MREILRSAFFYFISAGVGVGRMTLRWAYSSVGKSARLISVRSVVQIHLGPPIPPRKTEPSGNVSAGAVAQWEERRFCTPEVAGSSPVSSIEKFFFIRAIAPGSGVLDRCANGSLTIEQAAFFVLTKLYGQVIKSIRGMPWRRQATKDVASCEKLR